MEYQDTLYRVAKSRLNNEDDVCDAVQNTLISAYKSIENLRDIKNFKSWILKILINKCNDFYIIPERRNISIEELENKDTLKTVDFSENFEIDYLIKHLSKDEQLILTLYYAEGYNEKEISKLLKMNYATVRVKIKRAKEKIALKLKKGEI